MIITTMIINYKWYKDKLVQYCNFSFSNKTTKNVAEKILK